MTTTETTVTGYENQGFVAFMQGATPEANPWVADFRGHAEWARGYAMAAAMPAKPECAPLPINTVRDQATGQMDPRGYRVTFVRIGANWSRASAEAHAEGIRRMGRKAEVIEITPAEQLEIFAGAWDGFTRSGDLDSPVEVGDWERA